METIARDIGAELLGAPPGGIKIQEIIGRGSVNRVFKVTGGGQTVVLRLREGAAALEEYCKEAWCIERAARAGVPGPQVLSVGERGGMAYIAERFVEGQNGADAEARQGEIWQALGRFARVIHGIPAAGYGLGFRDGAFRDNFAGSFENHVRYNFERLTDGDPLAALGVCPPAMRGRVQAIFSGLLRQSLPLGLCHGDLSPRNVIVNGAHFALIDWGCAIRSVCPHCEFVALSRAEAQGEPVGEGALAAFLRGYGMMREAHRRMLPDIEALQLLDAFDKLRWAIDRSPGDIGALAAYAAAVRRKMLDE